MQQDKYEDRMNEDNDFEYIFVLVKMLHNSPRQFDSTTKLQLSKKSRTSISKMQMITIIVFHIHYHIDIIINHIICLYIYNKLTIGKRRLLATFNYLVGILNTCFITLK